jgi:hypothetical protein
MFWVQELKGNIRVFCRVRPPLPEEEKESGAEPPLVQYATSAELAGRGVELVPSAGGQSCPSSVCIIWEKRLRSIMNGFRFPCICEKIEVDSCPCMLMKKERIDQYLLSLEATQSPGVGASS